MPKNLRENFPYFCQTMQMVVTTITRMRDSLEAHTLFSSSIGDEYAAYVSRPLHVSITRKSRQVLSS